MALIALLFSVLFGVHSLCKTVTACSGPQNPDSNGISSFPSSYNSGSDCYYSFTTDPGRFNVVHFTAFDTETNFDYVTVCECTDDYGKWTIIPVST